VHVFGRTANPAHSYYYRRYEVTQNGTALWTPWEAVPVDIHGTLLVPVVFNRRLYLFWALVANTADAPPADSESPQNPKQYQEIQLAWSQYRNGAWSPKQVTEQALKNAYTPRRLSVPPIYARGGGGVVVDRLEAGVSGDQLEISCVGSRYIYWPNDEKKSDPVNAQTPESGEFDEFFPFLPILPNPMGRATTGGDDSQGVRRLGTGVHTDNLGSFGLNGWNGQ